jgi:hypothetical protein
MSILTTNPKIDGTQVSVPNLLDGLPRQAYSLRVSGTIPIPPWYQGIFHPINDFSWHYQGIAPYNGDGGGGTIGNGVISASSTVGYFSGFSQAQNQAPEVRSVVVPDDDYFHCAGIQMLGDVLPAPLESSIGAIDGIVFFYNVGNLASPSYLYFLDMPSTKASATAIANYTDSSGVEQTLLLVYEYDHQQMYIYQALNSEVANGASAWQAFPTYTGGAFQTGDQYQSFALVTQSNGSGPDTVYLLGFREDEELWLWTVSTDANSLGQPTLVTHYTGWNGSDWRNGMGLEIASTVKLRLFGTDKDPSGTSAYPQGPADYHFDIWIYGN